MVLILYFRKIVIPGYLYNWKRFQFKYRKFSLCSLKTNIYIFQYRKFFKFTNMVMKFQT